MNAFRLAAPAESDRLAIEGAIALGQALGVCRKIAARRIGRSVDVIDRMLAGHDSSPVYRFTMLLAICDNPYALVAFVRTTAFRFSIRRKSTPDLVARWLDITCSLEPRAEGQGNAAETDYFRSGDLLALAEADEKVIALKEERAATSRELARRNVDPRSFK